uniref:NB-ARC domain-containing protein n=1 Tax=Solanum lycopersicum TaxID=4081 RepID=A0A3Q7H7R8_SOLLC
MADAVVSFAVQKLGDFLIKKVYLRKSLRDEITYTLSSEMQNKRKVEIIEFNNGCLKSTLLLMMLLLYLRLKVLRLMKFYNVANDIQPLKQRIKDISCKRETYDITYINSNTSGEGTSNQVRTLRRTTSDIDDHDYIFVGLQDVVQTLLAQLLKPDPRRTVLSIYGMGGLGKTMLAKNIYNNPNIVSSFATLAWICVSQ